jgi:uncharacterized membrane protein (UPF0127 family)
MNARRAVRAAAAAVLLLVGCDGALQEAPPAPPSVAVRIVTAQGPVYVSAEVARTGPQREQGLMEREALGENEGMLFVYSAPRPADAGFWMYHTRIPLDIAFIDAQGRIVAVRTMEPCASDDPARCPVYRSEAAYQSALEVNAGFLERHGVAPGDRVELAEVDG